MPYATGSANNFTDVLNALLTLATANGWTWDNVALVLSKGNVYAKLTVNGVNPDFMRVQGAEGLVGGVLTNPTSMTPQMHATCLNPIVWPVTYHILIGDAPETVAIFINHATYWQWMLFGQGINFGVPGLATYYSATFHPNGQSSTSRVTLDRNGSQSTNGFNMALPFFHYNTATFMIGNDRQNCVANINFEGCRWANESLFNNQPVRAIQPVDILMQAQPNTWNGEAVLLPFRVMGARPSGLYSYLFELGHIRILRNTNYNDGDVITLGPDKWKVFPGRQKNTTFPDVGSAANWADHSGTWAMAIRYDGP